MNTMKNFLSMAALALVGAVMTGCSSDDNIQQPANNDNAYILKTTISFDTDDVTNRALSVDFLNKKATKTFAVNDQVVLFYIDGKGISRRVVSSALTAPDISADGKTANLTFDVSASLPATNGAIRYVYPANMASTNDNSNFDLDDEHTIDFSNLNNQDGTLTTLGSSLDLCVFDGNFSGTNLPASASLTNQLSVLAITLKDNASPTTNDITSTITGLTVNDGTNNYAVTRAAAAGPIYVAILPTASANIDITATAGVNNYEKSLTNKTYAKNNVYNVSWSMIPKVNLSSSSGDFNVTGDMIVTGTPAGNLNIKFPNKDCTVTLDNVNPLGAHSVTIEGSNSKMTVKLKGTSKLESIQANSATELIIDEAASGGTVIIESDNLTPLDNSHVTINGGTVMARYNNDDGYEAVSGNLTVNGGAVYLATQNASAVYGTISGSVTLYGWDGSDWVSDTAKQYVTSDNTSGNPASWTYWQ